MGFIASYKVFIGFIRFLWVSNFEPFGYFCKKRWSFCVSPPFFHLYFQEFVLWLLDSSDRAAFLDLFFGDFQKNRGPVC